MLHMQGNNQYGVSQLIFRTRAQRSYAHDTRNVLSSEEHHGRSGCYLMPCSSTGPCLLDLPIEILHEVKKHFDAKEWAEGSCQACKCLHRMPWRAISVSVPYDTKVTAPFTSTPPAGRESYSTLYIIHAHASTCTVVKRVC